jgi:4-hydroxybenzoate polyprenyltransferase
MAPAPAPVLGAGHALVVDLDGALVHTDLSHESSLSKLVSDLSRYALYLWPFRESAPQVGEDAGPASRMRYESLPYDENVLALVRQARAQGRPTFLVSRASGGDAEAIAEHLALFDGVLAIDGDDPRAGDRTAQRLVEVFGAGGFDYVGHRASDLPIWSKAEKAYGVRIGNSARQEIGRQGLAVEDLSSHPPSVRTWLKALRVHQYAKNTLVFIALFTSHSFSFDAGLSAFLAFVSFCACASAVYIINDLIDLESDRLHPTKRKRPFASGAIPVLHAAVAVPALLVAAAALALFVSLEFAGVILFYFALTTAYSFSLKRKMLIDVVVLASLYTIRVIGGAVAIEVAISEWLLAFSMFIFTALALVKRYTELTAVLDRGLPDPSNRNYKSGDLPVVAAVAAASGFNAVTVFALYVASQTVRELYTRPALLWLVCPLLMYWLARALMMAHRRTMNDDPVVFALYDRISRIVFGLIVLIVLAAI